MHIHSSVPETPLLTFYIETRILFSSISWQYIPLQASSTADVGNTKWQVTMRRCFPSFEVCHCHDAFSRSLLTLKLRTAVLGSWQPSGRCCTQAPRKHCDLPHVGHNSSFAFSGARKSDSYIAKYRELDKPINEIICYYVVVAQLKQ